MGEWTAGLAAFGLYFLYDWNRVYRKNGWMKPFFAAGSLLLGLVLLVPALEPLFAVAPLSIGMVGAVVGLAFGSMLMIQLLKLIRR